MQYAQHEMETMTLRELKDKSGTEKFHNVVNNIQNPMTHAAKASFYQVNTQYKQKHYNKTYEAMEWQKKFIPFKQ